MTGILFRNARIFDGHSGDCAEGCAVRVADGLIQEVSTGALRAGDAEVIDCGGRTLMPGLIDAHVHVYAASFDVARDARLGAGYAAHYASRFLRHALDRGFTTVRDVGGGDRSLAQAIADGLLDAPRFFYGGRVLSQTGGHGDFRSADEDGAACGCAAHGSFGMAVVDGPQAVRLAVREELRRGAHHIKLMSSGGVTSPTDPIDRCQYADDEIRVAVEEAARAGAYVAAHCHPLAAIRRAIELGVRSIEHATLIDADTAALAAAHGSYCVPTLAVSAALQAQGAALGLPSASLDKLARIAEHALTGLDHMQQAGVHIGFGTDLIGPLHRHTELEFQLRRQVQSPLNVLRSACSVNAALLQQPGRLGCIAPGAHADLLVVDGDPLRDPAALAAGGALAMIMKAGRFHKRQI
ncbi:metal-dependent hydrolase family protein [Solimonas flava]|uniref:metal-dependent hydrolase family protein n=1 Tax=Solimonas flava TaxID=415849 RepID=UPI00040F5B33|nr:amidohydrolase family protein [Solimonas flava]